MITEYTPAQHSEFDASAIDKELLNLNIGTIDLSWTSQNIGGMEVENEDILTTIDILGWEIDRNNGAAITNSQRNKLKKMIGAWCTLPFYGLSDRLIAYETRFKFTNPPINPKTGKPQKYLGSVGAPLRAYLPNIPDVLWVLMREKFGVEKSGNCYGEWLLDNPVIPAIIGEGEKKALSGTSVVFPTVGISGCDCGYIAITDDIGGDKQYQLIPDLFALAAGGRDIYLALDRDIKRSTQRAVKLARKRLAQLLYEAGAGRVFSLQWDEKKAKGLDDFIFSYGADGLGKAIDDAYEIPRPKLNDEAAEKKSIPTPLEMSAAMVDNIFKNTRYDASTKQWWRYDGSGKWLPSADEYIFGVAQKFLMEVLPDFSPSYVRNCVEFARTHLLHEGWTEASSLLYLPFENGVLELATKKLLPHSPDYGFTWQLPRDYSILATDWDNIDRFLNSLTCDNLELRNIAIGFCNAVIKGRWQLQHFLYLFGSGANGKGALMTLITMLIGAENTFATTMSDLNGNRFEASNLLGKRLLLMADEDRQTGGVAVFRNATGGDALRYERKGKDATNFIFKGMAIMAANKPTFVGDSDHAIKRRKIDFPCNARIASKNRRDLSPEFEADLPAFTTFLLSLSDDWVEETIRKAANVEAVKSLNWEMTIRENSTAAYYNDRLILAPLGSIACGKLYQDYQDYCEESGLKPKSHNNFTPSLLELVNISLEKSISVHRTKQGREIQGLRLRYPNEHDVDEEKKKASVGANSGDGDIADHPNGCSPVQLSVPLGVAPEFASSKDGVAHVAQSNFLKESENNKEEEKTKTTITPHEKVPGEGGGEKQVGATPTIPSKKLGATPPPLFGCTRLHQFKMGDRVRYTGNDRNEAKQYAGELIIYELKGDRVNCKKPDGRLTSWIDLSDLEAIV